MVCPRRRMGCWSWLFGLIGGSTNKPAQLSQQSIHGKIKAKLDAMMSPEDYTKNINKQRSYETKLQLLQNKTCELNRKYTRNKFSVDDGFPKELRKNTYTRRKDGSKFK